MNFTIVNVRRSQITGTKDTGGWTFIVPVLFSSYRTLCRVCNRCHERIVQTFFVQIYIQSGLYSVFSVSEQSKHMGHLIVKKKKKPYFLHYHARQIKSKRKLSLSHYKRNNDVHDIWWFTRKQMDRKAEGKQLKYTGKLDKKECKLQAIYHGYCLHQADETPTSFPQCMWHIWHLVILTKMFLV